MTDKLIALMLNRAVTGAQTVMILDPKQNLSRTASCLSHTARVLRSQREVPQKTRRRAVSSWWAKLEISRAPSYYQQDPANRNFELCPTPRPPRKCKTPQKRSKREGGGLAVLRTHPKIHHKHDFLQRNCDVKIPLLKILS